MVGWKRTMGAVAALGVLASCAAEPPPPPPGPSTGHVSPPAIPAATVPPGTFNEADAANLLSQARAQRLAGNAQAARASTEAALARWPGSLDSWSELLADCKILDDANCLSYAAFFHDKVEFVAPLAPRVAMLGFQNIAEEPAGAPKSAAAKGKSGGYDRRTVDMARLLEAFYNLKDPDVANRDAPLPQSYLERHPYAPLAGAGALGALGGGIWLLTK